MRRLMRTKMINLRFRIVYKNGIIKDWKMKGEVKSINNLIMKHLNLDKEYMKNVWTGYVMTINIV